MKALLALLLAAPALAAGPAGAPGAVARLQAVSRKADAVKAAREKAAREKAEAARELRRARSRLKALDRRGARYDMDVRWARLQHDRFSKRGEALARSERLWRASLREDAARYYAGLASGAEEAPAARRALRRVLLARAAFLSGVLESREVADLSARNWGRHLETFADKKERTEAARERAGETVEQRRARLSAAAAEESRLTRELASLEKSSRELESLVKRLGDGPKRRTRGSGDGKAKRGGMLWPVEGKVLDRFGKVRVPELDTWFVREGVRLGATLGQPVRAAAAGEVIFAGPFRSYGNVVIVDHGRDIYSVYGGLERVRAGAGERVVAGEVVGLAGAHRDDLGRAARLARAEASLYFEVRRGRRAVDPIPWLKERK